MSAAPTTLRDLAGSWAGPNTLWFAPGTPAFESEATAHVYPTAGGRYLVLDYTWSHDGKPHQGHLVLRLAETATTVDAIWVDSFHQSGSFMLMSGASRSASGLSVRGGYAAPPGPDWGWRITLTAESQDHCVLMMYNITPDGEEADAVRMELRRTAPQLANGSPA